jgi:iron complex transport system ATP-binding protein
MLYSRQQPPFAPTFPHSSAATRSMLTADVVSFAYGSTPVLSGVSFTATHAGIVGILGPNGSGKTTLLRLITGAIRPQGGHITIDGADIGTLPRRALARRMAVVAQETHSAFDYTAMEVVLMGRYAHLGAFELEGPDDLAAATSAMQASGTAHLGHRLFPTLSGGEKQRVVIASALAQLDTGGMNASGAKPILLLDEPTASLDLRYQIELVSLLTRLNADREVTIVLTTHDLRFAAAVCRHVILLGAGRVLGQGAPQTVLTDQAIRALYGIPDDVASPLLPQ